MDWVETEPFDYEGDFYRLQRANSQVRCYQQPHLPLFLGGRRRPPWRSGASTPTCSPSWENSCR
jgi:alkanesulfonate monooxygenase SsuD/methylene tetrahydromethanopterin reductase-like flavin-dependent oxidoreductase (luciferase family)